MSGAVLDVEGELTVFTVHALRDRLLAAMNASTEIEVKLAEVSEVDGAGVQLLLAARHEAQQRGITLRIAGQPPALSASVRAALDLIGLDEGLDSHASAGHQGAHA